MNRKTMAVALTLALGLTLSVYADNKDKDTKAPSAKEFVTTASSSGLKEVTLAEYAVKNAASDDVKGFARHMLEDHTKANKALLEAAAKTQGLLPPVVKMNAKDTEDVEKLFKLRGEEFDKAYMKAMLDDHEAAVTLFESEAKGGDNDALKSFASDTLKTLKEHRDMAQKVADKVGVKKDTKDSKDKDKKDKDR